MAIRVVQLGGPRARGEGPRLGTVRRPPRGVPRSQYASRNFYDIWLPELAPSADLVKLALRARDGREWRTFAALSHHTAFSVGCYCADEARCHRSVLKTLLEEHGARLEPRKTHLRCRG